MAMLDTFFSKRFNAGKCKTMLKLTIPRIKLLRNRREIQLKQMRREIAKLLETGQKATARIKVEHIIREENMMAAHEIIELFCELITARLPIIEAQRECPLDLKEAISSLCFAAPRCGDLTELLQVQMMFSGKYGKEFVAAAMELMPECGVNRQLVELLSIRAPAPDVKLKLLKDIAEEHELDWDPNASESEFFKPHEDLLHGSAQFISVTKLALPTEKHDATEHSDEGFAVIDSPEVPIQPLQSRKVSGSEPEMLPFPPSALPESDDLHEKKATFDSDQMLELKPEDNSSGSVEVKQFLPFVSPPSHSPASFSTGANDFPTSVSKTNSDNIDLQDVLAAAHAAAESTERAAASARLAASIAELRISGLTKKSNEDVPVSTIGNPYAFHFANSKSEAVEKDDFDKQKPFEDSDSPVSSPNQNNVDDPNRDVVNPGNVHHQPQRLPSIEDEPYFTYPNLFTSQASNLSSGSESK